MVRGVDHIMFVVVICGGCWDGERIGKDGWPVFDIEPPYMFDDYADAQDWIMGRQARLADGDYGVGATLGIDEMDGDIKYEQY